MASDVDIVNLALAMLSVSAITSLTEESKAANLANAVYTSIRDSTLRDAEWNFAQVRVSLNQLTTAPAYGFLYAYILPVLPYCLRVNETDPDDAVYRIESNADNTLRVLVTDEPTMKIRYTARVTDPSLYDASFVLAFAMNLAANLALPLTELQSVAEGVQKKYEALVSRGMTADAQEGSTQSADINVLLDVRRLGFRDFDRSRNRFA